MSAPATTDPRVEERAARDRQRQLERMRRGAARARESQEAAAIREAAQETRSIYRTCRCDFRGVRTRRVLLEMGGGCTMPEYGCPRLSAVRFKTNAWGH